MMYYIIGIIELVLLILFLCFVIAEIVKLHKLKKEKENENGTQNNIIFEDGVNFKVNKLTFEEQIKALNKEQRRYFKTLREYALKKQDAKERQTKSAILVGVSKAKPILKLSVRKGVILCSFKLENDLLRNYKRTTGATADMIHQKETEVLIHDDEMLKTALGMIDLMVEQHEKELQEAKERKRLQEAKRRAEKKALQDN